jgi:hypothetical protein
MKRKSTSSRKERKESANAVITARKVGKKQPRHIRMSKKDICETEKIFALFLSRNPSNTDCKKSCPQKPSNTTLSNKRSKQTRLPEDLFSTLDAYYVENPSVKMTAITNSEIRTELAIAVK